MIGLLVLLTTLGRGEHPDTPPWALIQDFAEELNQQVVHVGWLLTRSGQWQLTAETARNYRLYLAVLRVAACDLRRAGCVGARLVSGVAKLSPLDGMCSSTVLWWTRRGRQAVSWAELDPARKVTVQGLTGDTWSEQCLVQFCFVAEDQQQRFIDHRVPHQGQMMEIRDDYHEPDDDADTTATDKATAGSNAPNDDLPEPRGQGRPREGRDEDEDDRPTQWRQLDYDDHSDSSVATEELWSTPWDADLWNQGFAEERAYEAILDESGGPDAEWHLAADTLLCVGGSQDDSGCPSCPGRSCCGCPRRTVAEHSKAEIAEERPALELSRQFAGFLEGLPRQLEEDENVVLYYKPDGTYQAVIEQEADALTPEELVKHEKQVAEAMLEELKRWSSLGSFQRKAKKDSYNRVDCR